MMGNNPTPRREWLRTPAGGASFPAGMQGSAPAAGGCATRVSQQWPPLAAFASAAGDNIRLMLGDSIRARQHDTLPPGEVGPFSADALALPGEILWHRHRDAPAG